jgi:hypothetical protein
MTDGEKICYGASEVTVSAPGADCWHIVDDTHAQVGVGRHCGGTAAQLADVPWRPMMTRQYCWLIWQKMFAEHWKQSADTPVQVAPPVSVPPRSIPASLPPEPPVPPSLPPDPPAAPSWPLESLLQELMYAAKQSSNASGTSDRCACIKGFLRSDS